MQYFSLRPVAQIAAFLAAGGLAAPFASFAQAPSASGETAFAEPAETSLPEIRVSASADASAQGLSPAYPGGQVARGARVGVLGTKSALETPFSFTAYTNDLMVAQQARSVGEVLENDPTVRLARGFGNFQESYFIRGFVLSSDDVAYNGLYGLLPRQYTASELVERVEVLRGASAFLNGASPGGGGIGGSVNLVPKRAPNEPLNRLTFGIDTDGFASASADVARRMGPDDSLGVRVNVAQRKGGSGVQGEDSELGLVAVGADWRSRDVRLSGDIGYQDNQLKATRPNVTLGSGVTTVPRAPDNETNYAQPWSFSNERDVFGTLRAEYDVLTGMTAWAAAGSRHTTESNSLANVTVSNGVTGAASTYRFDNARRDSVVTAEAGLRGTFRTGAIGHEWVASASTFKQETKNGYVMDSSNTRATNLYAPTAWWGLPFSGSPAFKGNTLDEPQLNRRIRLEGITLGDTLSMLDNDLLLTLGGRQQRLHVEGFAYNTLIPSAPYKSTRFSPSAAAVYKLTPRTSVYANYIESLADSGVAPSTAANRGETLPPYVSRQKEVGLKYDAGRYMLSAALFSTNKPRAVSTVNGIYAFSGTDRHRGLELGVQGEAFAGLRVLGGLTFLEARQVSTGSATTEGKRVIGVPDFQSTLGVEWATRAVPGLTLDARVLHTGDRYANTTNTLKVGGWTRLDVGARYLSEWDGRLWTLRARVENVMDSRYWASVGGNAGTTGYLVAGAPRTLGLSASVDF